MCTSPGEGGGATRWGGEDAQQEAVNAVKGGIASGGASEDARERRRSVTWATPLVATCEDMRENDEKNWRKEGEMRQAVEQVRRKKDEETPTRDEDERPATCRVDATNSDGLPTAMMKIKGVTVGVKLDTFVSFSIASTVMKRLGTRLRQAAPTASGQGLGGRELRVQVVWRFKKVTAYGQVAMVDALVIGGCQGELIISKNFFVRHRAAIDFQMNEVVYQDSGEQVILPFTCSAADSACVVRVVRGKNVLTQAQTLVEVHVATPDGEVGLFKRPLPRRRLCSSRRRSRECKVERSACRCST